MFDIVKCTSDLTMPRLVAKHLPYYPKVEGSSPASTFNSGRKTVAKNYVTMPDHFIR
jgi:hypothetical protein